MLFLEMRIEFERGEWMLFTVVAREPGKVGTRREPEGEINRKMRVDTFGLHRGDDLVSVPNLRQIGLAILVEHRAVDADEIDAVAGQQFRALAQFFPLQFLGRTVDRPEADWLAIRAVNELPIVGYNDAVFAGKCLIQAAEADQAFRHRGVSLRVE